MFRTRTQAEQRASDKRRTTFDTGWMDGCESLNTTVYFKTNKPLSRDKVWGFDTSVLIPRLPPQLLVPLQRVRQGPPEPDLSFIPVCEDEDGRSISLGPSFEVLRSALEGESHFFFFKGRIN